MQFWASALKMVVVGLPLSYRGAWSKLDKLNFCQQNHLFDTLKKKKQNTLMNLLKYRHPTLAPPNR